MNIIKSFDHTRSPTRKLRIPIEGINVYMSSTFLVNYPTSMDEPRESEIEINIPEIVNLPNEFYLVLRDVDSGSDQMRLYFKLEGQTESVAQTRSTRKIKLKRPNNETRYHVDIQGKKYLVVVSFYVPIVIRESGTHKFLFELRMENPKENRIEFIERFYIFQDIRVRYITSKVFDNQFYQSIVGSILSYASGYPLNVYKFEKGELKDMGKTLYKPCRVSYKGKREELTCLNALRDDLDRLITELKPNRPDEYLILVGTKSITETLDKSFSAIFFEELLDFFTEFFPVYIVGKQAEYVGGTEKLFINMFIAPPERIKEYVKDYLDVISRKEFVNDVGYIRVEDLTLVKQGDFYLLVTPIITLDFLKELIATVNRNETELSLLLLKNFKEYQVKKIRKYQSEILEKLLRKKFNYNTPSFYFSKAIYELTSSDCRNSHYYIPFSSLLLQREGSYLFSIPFVEEQLGCKVYYGLGDLFVNILLDGSLILLGGIEKVINTVRNIIERVNELDIDIVKQLDARHEFLMRFLNDLIVTIFFNNKTQPKPDVRKIAELSIKAFAITSAKLKYDMHRVYALLERICYNPRSSFTRNILRLVYDDNREKFIYDLILTLRDAYFIKLLEANGIKVSRSHFYLLGINKANVTKSEIKSATTSMEGLIDFYYKHLTRHGKRGKDVILPLFRQYMLNTLIRGLRLPPENEIPSKFNAEEFASVINEIDCGLPFPVSSQSSLGVKSTGYETFRNVALPIIIYVPDRNTITVNNRTIIVTRKNFELFSFTTPIITLEDGFSLSHHGHKITVKGEQVYLEHEGNEHPEIIITLKFPQAEEVVKLINDEKKFVENFNKIFNTHYTSALTIIKDIIDNAKSQGLAFMCANIQPMVNPSVITSNKFKPGSIKVGLLTLGRRDERDTGIIL